MENDKLQKSSGLLFSSDLISKLFVALIVVFIPGLIVIIIEKYACGKTTLVWQFPTDYWLTEDEKNSIISGITNSQALFNCLKPKDEFHKKELIQNRIYAYKYEDFIFELFSKRGIHYNERLGWLVDKESIPYDAFKSTLEKRFSMDSEEAVSVIAELHAKKIIVDLSLGDRKGNVYIGDILTKYWYIVSMEDMNFNKYCKIHESAIISSKNV